MSMSQRAAEKRVPLLCFVFYYAVTSRGDGEQAQRELLTRRAADLRSTDDMASPRVRSVAMGSMEGSTLMLDDVVG